MTREKIKPAIHKPDFDVDGILRFASPGGTPGCPDNLPDGKGPKRTALTLMLKIETVDQLKAEAARKEKTVEQIVEKLVSKHLNKH